MPHKPAVYRGERRVGPFSKSTHPCKNDQSHEFADRESLADQRRQRQIMREWGEMVVGVRKERERGQQGGNIQRY